MGYLFLVVLNLFFFKHADLWECDHAPVSIRATLTGLDFSEKIGEVIRVERTDLEEQFTE